jgi:hypothetical protein
MLPDAAPAKMFQDEVEDQETSDYSLHGLLPLGVFGLSVLSWEGQCAKSATWRRNRLLQRF